MGRDALIPPEVLPILWEAWDSPFTTKSNLAKESADEVAIAASEGLISVRLGCGHGRVWHITPAGLHCLWGAIHSTTKQEEHTHNAVQTLPRKPEAG